MRTTHAVEAIFGNRSRVRVLRVLEGVRVPLNASQVAARSGLSQPGAATALNELAELGLVERSGAGRANVYWLVRDNVFAETMVAPVFSAERDIPEIMEAELREAFAGKAVSVVLFGSYARGEQREESDVDVALVAADERSKRDLDEAVDGYALDFRRRFGASLSPVVYDLDEAASLWERAPQLQQSIEKDGLVVSGIPPREWRTAHGAR